MAMLMTPIVAAVPIAVPVRKEIRLHSTKAIIRKMDGWMRPVAAVTT